jgi:RNA polymerase sigma factor (sigma-70 family)
MRGADRERRLSLITLDFRIIVTRASLTIKSGSLNFGEAALLPCVHVPRKDLSDYCLETSRHRNRKIDMQKSSQKPLNQLQLKTGEALEREVERVFRLLGADTKRRILIDSYEIDLLVKFSKGPMEITQIVECKEYNRKTRVSDLDMRSFVVKLLAAREARKADRGVFVSTSRYSKTALATAARHQIKCLTLEELRNQLIDVSEYLTNSLTDFERSDLSNWYVHQTGSDIEDYDSLLGTHASAYLHSPLIDYVDQVFTEEDSKRLALLGNFGTGKTSFCLKYRNVLLERYKADPANRIPILISLRDYRSGMDIHQAATEFLQKLPGVQIDLKLFLELQRMGRFFFLLDGLDEMATKVDRSVINESLREIDRLNGEGDNLYLLTCRTHFFQERIADEFLRDYRVVYLADWGPEELKLYLQKRFKTNWRKYLNQIQSSSTLFELSKTPLLVDMILKSLSKFESGQIIDVSKLFKTYTDDWIIGQSMRRGAVMSAHQRRKFSLNLAVKLFTETKTYLHFSELYEVAREFSGYGDATRLDYFDTDARTCTFISKDSKGNYGFRYKSFMEYFCASAIIDQVNGDDPSTLSAKDVTQEVLEFFDGDQVAEGGVVNLQKWSSERSKEVLSGNSRLILLRIGKPIPIEAGTEPTPEASQQMDISSAEWEMLSKAVSESDSNTFEKFLNDNLSDLSFMARSALRSVPDTEYDPEDLVNEALIRLWTRGKVPEVPGALVRPYLYRVMKNILIDRYRLAKTQRRMPMDSLDFAKEGPVDTHDVQRELELREEANKVLAVLDDLPTIHKQIFIAKYIEGKSIEEICGELQMSTNAVRTLLYRTRAMVAKLTRLPARVSSH